MRARPAGRRSPVPIPRAAAAIEVARGPGDGYELVQRGEYTLVANGYWGPVSRTLHLT